MNYGQFGTPGFTALAETVDSELFWGAEKVVGIEEMKPFKAEASNKVAPEEVDTF